jgi:hypothetical protein
MPVILHKNTSSVSLSFYEYIKTNIQQKHYFATWYIKNPRIPIKCLPFSVAIHLIKNDKSDLILILHRPLSLKDGGYPWVILLDAYSLTRHSINWLMLVIYGIWPWLVVYVCYFVLQYTHTSCSNLAVFHYHILWYFTIFDVHFNFHLSICLWAKPTIRIRNRHPINSKLMSFWLLSNNIMKTNSILNNDIISYFIGFMPMSHFCQ